MQSPGAIGFTTRPRLISASGDLGGGAARPQENSRLRWSLPPPPNLYTMSPVVEQLGRTAISWVADRGTITYDPSLASTDVPSCE